MKKAFLLLLTGLITLTGINAENLNLTIEDSVKHALKENLSLKQSQINLKQAERNKKYSWNSINPSASISANYSKNLPEGNFSDEGSISLSARINLALSANLASSIKDARLKYEASEISYESACRSIELSVRKAFWALLNEKENIALQRKNEETAKNQYETNLSKYNKGSLSQLDVLSAQVSWQNAKLNLEKTLISHQSNLSVFKQMLNLSQDTEITLEGNLNDILELKEVNLDGIEIKNLNLLSIENQIANAKNSLTAARFSAYSPSLSAGYSYSMYAGTDNLENLSDSASGSISFGASIPLDGLFPWSSKALNIDAQKDNIEKLELELENQKNNIDISIQNYLNQIKEYLSAIELRKSSITLAEQTYNMTLEAYNHGRKDLLSLQTANDSLFTARVNLLSQGYLLICALLDLENITGLDFGTL